MYMIKLLNKMNKKLLGMVNLMVFGSPGFYLFQGKGTKHYTTTSSYKGHMLCVHFTNYKPLYLHIMIYFIEVKIFHHKFMLH